MKLKLLTIIAFVLFSSSQSYGENRADSIRAKFLDPHNKEILVAVHRGDWRNFAENSLEGIENAIRLGADIVEIDLRKTKDGHLILMHDSSINRTTTGKGKVSDLTLDSIRNVYLRSGVGEMTPYRVPTLEEALKIIKGRLLVNLDKAFDYFDQVYEIIENTGTTSQIIMKGGADAKDVKEKYGRYLDKVIYMPVVNLDKDDAIDRIKNYKKILKSPAYELVYCDSLNTKTFKAKELLYGTSRIWYNTLWSTLAGGRDDFASLKDPAAGYGFLIDSLGASILQTDQLVYLSGYLFDRKLKSFHCDPKVFNRCKNLILDNIKAKELSKDWAQFGIYKLDNDSIINSAERPNVVFIGNSITKKWIELHPKFFKCNNIIDRGISGQVSSQMLVRFQEDVIRLKPKVVVIMAGTNDIADNNGQISVNHILQNIISMCQLAKVNGIEPILSSLLPVTKYPWQSRLNHKTKINDLNSLIKDYSKNNNISFVDYYSEMSDNNGNFLKGLSIDGVHPSEEGYKIMEKKVTKIIANIINCK